MTFLDRAALVELTGKKQKGKQIAVLRKKRIRHIVNATGHPVVKPEWLDGERPSNAPNFAALEESYGQAA